MNVSIVTSVLNGEKHISRCIESVKAQTIKCEHVVVDGGSDDDSVAIAREAGVPVVVEATGSSISEALNIGIRNSGGDVIAILNSDDWFEPHTVETSLQALKSFPSAGFTYGNVILHFLDHEVIVRPRAVGVRLAHYATRQTPFPHISSFVRRDVYDRYGLYDAACAVAMDFEFYARIIAQGITGVYVDDILGHASAGGKSSDTVLRLRDYLYILPKYHPGHIVLLYIMKYAVNSYFYNSISPGSRLGSWLRSIGNRKLAGKEF